MVRQKRIPYSALFELTLRCNMRCIHCGSSAGKSRTKELTVGQWKAIIQELLEMGCNEITLIGGEPFLHRKWFDIARTIQHHEMSVSIISNGFCINEEIISKLTQLNPYGIAISIDGGIPETHDWIRQRPGSFHSCMQVLTQLKNANLPTSVITTLNKKNILELPLLRSILLNKGIAWQLQMASPIGRFPKELVISKEEFYAAALFIATTRQKYSMKELPIIGAHCFGYNSRILPNITFLPLWKGCQAGVTALGIQSDGGIKGCLSLPDEFIEGNIKNTSLYDIWNKSTAFLYNRRFSTKDLTNDCQSCSFGKICKGGCLSISTAATGKRHGDPYCLQTIEKNLI